MTHDRNMSLREAKARVAEAETAERELYDLVQKAQDHVNLVWESYLRAQRRLVESKKRVEDLREDGIHD